MVGEAIIDKKGRLVIPAHIRQELGLREGDKVKITLQRGRILLTRPVTPEEFISEMEGFIKDDSKIPEVNPLELKKIWEKQ
ncbi:AbrB/MazE/SpoVT family DNA-binding domain-containing protein [Candidatus Bathyarchaeota archaeon]|nr:AbrB/MazE/SpoVT family DNA-binding domain-containing protein [Candidatus Bathyarchaeota archaeon]